ncbi:VOC family protein [Streptomyces iconiensis]|uniref:VOC family protein n=1 Tax=Streptomyces iconiensis TaxID=1384038 RepID=A0ABT6ZWB1_9ACTN|nr:VOC family protein [Streptomyces iconiensis]MDJ1132911.1 VOC family protein [Streptomyces iconiensis]
MAARFKDLALEAADHQSLADWWCSALGYVRREPPAGYTEQPREWPVPIYDPEGSGPLIWLNPVSEPSEGSRMHLDVFGDTEELLALGARLVRRRDKEIGWDILEDPEGNKFCVFDPKPRVVRR